MADNRQLRENLCWEIGIVQQMKHGESICGDCVSTEIDEDRVRIVLSDGLGSGIQANIAATLTSTMISELTGNGFTVEEGIRAVDAVLPVTKKQKLAYATFTLAAAEGTTVRLVQYDNPPALFLRDGVSLDYPMEMHTIREKTLFESKLKMKNGDMLVLFSDGVSEAGRGVTTYSGWDRRELEDYLLRSIGPDDCARRVAAGIISAVQALDLYEFHDDTTVVVLRLRERLPVNLLIIPNGDTRVDPEFLESYMKQPGEHVICGKRTSRTPENAVFFPEGCRTIRETLSLMEHYLRDGMMSLSLGETQDDASKLLELLTEKASEINIMMCREPHHEERFETERETAELILRMRELLQKAGKKFNFRF